MTLPSCSLTPLLLLLVCLGGVGWCYEAPEDKDDIFSTRACPAFLSFSNAAYLSGVTVELPCHCKPQQVHSVVWFYQKHLDSPEETRVLTDHHGNTLTDSNQVVYSGDLRTRFSIRLFSLLIFRAGPDDSGLYLCGSAHKDFFYGYDLDIQEVRAVTLSQMFTSYRSWSVCDRCGVPGEQVRVGLCYVHSHFLHVRYRRANQTAASCGSGAVPRAFGLSQHSRGGARLEVRGCHVTCPPQAPPPPKILALMAFLGHSTSSQPVGVQVFYLSHPADRPLVLRCPVSRPHLVVAWDRGSEPIYRSQHTSGRYLKTYPSSRPLIDTGQHLVFNPARIEDSGVYFCWLQGCRAAEIHLLVYAHLGHGQALTSHPDFQSALQTVVMSYAVMTTGYSLVVLGRAGVKYLRDTRY